MNDYTANDYFNVEVINQGIAFYNLEEWPIATLDNIRELMEDEELEEVISVGKVEVREGEVETEIECEYSRHYESKSVASQILGRWVGWTFWYGGGKHAEPEEIDIDAYFLDCEEEEKMVIVRRFSK